MHTSRLSGQAVRGSVRHARWRGSRACGEWLLRFFLRCSLWLLQKNAFATHSMSYASGRDGPSSIERCCKKFVLPTRPRDPGRTCCFTKFTSCGPSCLRSWLDRLHFFGPQTVVLQIFCTELNICKTRLTSIGSKLGFNLVKS